jgi:hypothetical protein
MALAAHVAHLRALIVLDPDSRLLDVALVNVVEELAEAIDGLRGRVAPDDPPDDGNHLGTI